MEEGVYPQAGEDEDSTNCMQGCPLVNTVTQYCECVGEGCLYTNVDDY